MNDSSKLPKYYLLKKELIGRIQTDELAPDQLIPSERELISLYSVSRITVRKALDEMVNEGYLYRIQGKGTYVKGKVTQQDLYSLVSMTRDIASTGKTPSRKVLRCEIIESYPTRASELNILTTDKLLVLDRIYFADGEPVNRTSAYLPYKYFPGIEKFDFQKNSLYDVLEKHYQLKITRASRTIEAIQAALDIADLLGIKEGTPILLFRGVTYGYINGKEVPIETFKAYYRSDNRKFLINQVRMG